METQDSNRPIWSLSIKEFLDLQQKQIEKAVSKFLSSTTNEAKSDAPLNIIEAAAYLKISKDALYQLTSKRLVPFMKSGKRNLFTKAILDEWISSKRQKTVNELETEVNESMLSKKGKKK